MTVFMRVALTFAIAFLMQACNMQKQAQGPASATAELKAGASVVVESRNGSVEIVGDESVSEVRVNSTIRCVGDTQEQAEARLAKASLDVAYDTSGVLTIKPVFPDGPQHNDGANITVRLPSADSVTVKTSNGPVRISKLAGTLYVDTSNGRITVLDHNGSAVIETSNAPVEVHRLAGSLNAETSNGRVEALDVGGPVTIDTSNGPILVSLGRDQVGPLKLDTSNGSITVKVGPAFAGNVQFDTSNGRVTVKDASSRIRNQQIVKNKGSITVGEGGANSIVDTSNGSINFEITG